MIRALAAAARLSRWPLAALGACLLAGALSAPGPASEAGTEPPALGPSACPWPELSGRRLLERSLGSVSFVNVGVWKIAADLVREYGVPISLIEASPATKVTVALPSCTLRQLLDRIVATASEYRYGFVGSHLVLYAKDPRWQARIDNLSLMSGARVAVSERLMKQLVRLHPSLGHFDEARYRGNLDSFILQDQVQVSGPATVIELLTQVLGERPSAVFALSTLGWPPPASLWLDTAAIVQSIEVTSATVTACRQFTEQLIGLVDRFSRRPRVPSPESAWRAAGAGRAGSSAVARTCKVVGHSRVWRRSTRIVAHAPIYTFPEDSWPAPASPAAGLSCSRSS